MYIRSQDDIVHAQDSCWHLTFKQHRIGAGATSRCCVDVDAMFRARCVPSESAYKRSPDDNVQEQGTLSSTTLESSLYHILNILILPFTYLNFYSLFVCQALCSLS